MKVLAVELHAAVNIGGLVAGTLNAELHTIEFEVMDNGVFMTRKTGTSEAIKFIPWANIKGVDYYNKDGSKPVAGAR